jgi:hypothetical protein
VADNLWRDLVLLQHNPLDLAERPAIDAEIAKTLGLAFLMERQAHVECFRVRNDPLMGHYAMVQIVRRA